MDSQSSSHLVVRQTGHVSGINELTQHFSISKASMSNKSLTIGMNNCTTSLQQVMEYDCGQSEYQHLRKQAFSNVAVFYSILWPETKQLVTEGMIFLGGIESIMSHQLDWDYGHLCSQCIQLALRAKKLAGICTSGAETSIELHANTETMIEAKQTLFKETEIEAARGTLKALELQKAGFETYLNGAKDFFRIKCRFSKRALRNKRFAQAEVNDLGDEIKGLEDINTMVAATATLIENLAEMLYTICEKLDQIQKEIGSGVLMAIEDSEAGTQNGRTIELYNMVQACGQVCTAFINESSECEKAFIQSLEEESNVVDVKNYEALMINNIQTYYER